MRALAVAAFATLALTLAPVAPAGVKNACLLVTAADVTKAVGKKVVATRHANLGGFNTCTYTLGKVNVTVQTRLLSHDTFVNAVKGISGTVLAATNIGPDAWVFFVKNGIALQDWANGNQLGIVVAGAGGGSNLIVAQLATAAHRRL